jgi:hypothetical protein
VAGECHLPGPGAGRISQRLLPAPCFPAGDSMRFLEVALRVVTGSLGVFSAQTITAQHKQQPPHSAQEPGRNRGYMPDACYIAQAVGQHKQSRTMLPVAASRCSPCRCPLQLVCLYRSSATMVLRVIWWISMLRARMGKKLCRSGNGPSMDVQCDCLDQGRHV